jgi:hypothetical protein
VSRRIKWLGLLGLALAPLACQPLPSAAGAQGTPQLVLESLPAANVVPADWGRLVTVTNGVPNGSFSLLWFQNDSGVVRIVGYDAIRRQLSDNARLIERH